MDKERATTAIQMLGLLRRELAGYVDHPTDRVFTRGALDALDYWAKALREELQAEDGE